MLVQQAIEKLDALPDSPARQELIALANTVVEREF
jgi:geranylgeranyl pyrophosphate synthase